MGIKDRLTLFRVENLFFFRHHRPLLWSVNFSLNQGDILYLKGDNGVGKTTLLKILAGLLKADSARFYMNDDDITKNYHYLIKGNIAYIGHENALSPSLSGIEHLQFWNKFYNCHYSDDELENIADKLKLLPILKGAVQCYSSGQKRKMALLRLLFVSAKIWLLDEPFVGLDEKSVKIIKKMLGDHLKEGAIIFTDHGNILEGYKALKTLSLQDLNSLNVPDMGKGALS